MAVNWATEMTNWMLRRSMMDPIMNGNPSVPQLTLGIHDLQGESTMSPMVGLLYAAVKENNQRLRNITSGMTLEELEYQGPNNTSNSTAQLIRHLTYVDLNWVYRIQGDTLPQSLIEQFGPLIDEDGNLPMVKGRTLDLLIAGYDDVLDRLKDVCTRLKDADLDRVVTFGHRNEKQATIRWGVWHIADHNRYHQAHINQLRRWYAGDTK
jgi:uncharacterized damage-inducible protein DinB